MATFYVDGLNGSDTYDGTVPDYTSGTTGPWATIQKAFDAAHGGAGLEAGDVVWVAPGTYRHNSAELDVKTNGALAAAAYVKGDPQCTRAWDSTIKPGIVRITRCDSNDQCTAGVLLDFNGKAYVEFWDFQMDGIQPTATTGNCCVDGDSGVAGQKLIRCVVMSGYYAARYIEADLCVLIGSSSSHFSSKAITRSLLLGKQETASVSGGTLDSCIIIGHGITTNPIAKNCLFIGCTYYSVPSDGIDRNVFLCCGNMTKGQSANPPQGCLGICCTNDVYSTETNNDLSQCFEISTYDCNAASNGGGTDPVKAKGVLWPPALAMLDGLRQTFGFRWAQSDCTAGTATSLTEGIDRAALETRVRSASASAKGPGPWGLSDREWIYDSTDGNTIKIYRTGQERLLIPLKKATAITISIQCDWDIDSGSTYPQIELLRQDDGTSLGTDAISGGDSQGHTLSIALTGSSVTDKDVMGVLLLKSRETTTNAYATFYGLTVS